MITTFPRINTPACELVIPDKAKASFRFLREPDIGSLDDTAIAREVNRLAKGRLDVNKTMIRESLVGAELSSAPREDYELTIELQGPLQEFFGAKQLRSTEKFSRNSALLPGGGITSSFHRLADRVTMLREVKGENGASDYYTGRVDTLPKAEEQAAFLFRSEREKGPLAKGISKDPTTGRTQFTFAVQSLLSTSPLQSDDLSKFEKAIKAYEALRNKKTIVVDGIEVDVYPLPPAATQFNFMTILEETLPEALSGKGRAVAASQKADAALFAYAKERIATFKPETQTQIQQAMAQLQNGSFKPWQQVLLRAYLSHLLNIPQVLHCKSSVDRTNAAGAAVTALKWWLHAKRPIPSSGICGIVDMKLKDGSEPFKELYALALQKGLKITEMARGVKGFKFYVDPKRELGLIPALHDLLPARYFISNNEVVRQIKIGSVRLLLAAALGAAFWAIASQFGMLGLAFSFALLSLCTVAQNTPYVKYPAALLLSPFQILIKADKLFPKSRLNLSSEEVGGRSLIFR